MRELKEHKKPSTSSDVFFKPTVQTKLAVGQAGDQYEQEADATADRVVNGTNSTSVKNGAGGDAKPLASGISSVQMKEIAPGEDDKTVQKKDDEKEQVQKKDEEQKEPLQKKDDEKETVQKKDEEQKEPLQKKEEEKETIQAKEEEEKPVQKKGNNAAVTSTVESKLGSRKGKGSALDGNVKREMESGFGADFGDVRIHNDSEAKNMAGEMGAQAFTHGNDIYFNEGKFDTESRKGKHLLAHELTHTIQQEGLSEKNIQRKGEEETETTPQIENSATEENTEKPRQANQAHPGQGNAQQLARGRRHQTPIMGGNFSHQLSGRFMTNNGSPSQLIILSRDFRRSVQGCNTVIVFIDGVQKGTINPNLRGQGTTRTEINIGNLPAGAHTLRLTVSEVCTGSIHASVMAR